MSATLDHLFDRNVAWVDGKTRADPDYFRRMANSRRRNSSGSAVPTAA